MEERGKESGIGQPTQCRELGCLDDHRLVGLAADQERDHTVVAAGGVLLGAVTAIDGELHDWTVPTACDTEGPMAARAVATSAPPVP